MSKGYVYILCDDHSKHVVKIGKASKDVGRRVRTLQTGNPWIREFVTVQSSKWNEIRSQWGTTPLRENVDNFCPVRSGGPQWGPTPLMDGHNRYEPSGLAEVEMASF